MSRSERSKLGSLASHLADVHGVEATETNVLDAGVLHVALAGGRNWVARVFPTDRPVDQAHGDAAILRFLAEIGYPAERLAAEEPVSLLDGQAVLVTTFIPGVPREQRRAAIRAAGGLTTLGSLLGRLHALPAKSTPLDRAGGAWHHLADGSPRDEISALRRLVDELARTVEKGQVAPLEQLSRQVDGLDDGSGLPEAFVHPDFVLANVIARPDGSLALVDWAGAGSAPRMWSLAFTLWSVGMNGDLTRVDRTIAGYRRHITPTSAELDRLEGLIRVRPTVFAAWSAATRRARLSDAVKESELAHRVAETIAERVHAAFSR